MEDFRFLIELVRHYGYIIIFLVIFIECMGIPFPGETILIVGAVMASLGHLNIFTVVVVAIIAAVVGDNIGYMIGKRYGRKIIKKFEHIPIFHYKHIERAEKFFKKHGNKTVFIGRFIAIIRTYAAVFAGIFDMPYPLFFFYNLTGGVVWAVTFGIIGYLLGDNLQLLKSIITNLNLMMAIIVVGVLGYLVIRMVRKRRNNKED